jgi:hypothetical protein
MTETELRAAMAAGTRLPVPPAPYDRGAYERGWRYSRRSGATLDHLDAKAAPEAEYDGYMDMAVGRPKWHLAWCGVNHRHCPEGGTR